MLLIPAKEVATLKEEGSAEPALMSCIKLLSRTGLTLPKPSLGYGMEGKSQKAWPEAWERAERGTRSNGSKSPAKERAQKPCKHRPCPAPPAPLLLQQGRGQSRQRAKTGMLMAVGKLNEIKRQ